MKTKKPSMEELKKVLDEIHNDSKLMDIAKKFVARLGGKA